MIAFAPASVAYWGALVLAWRHHDLEDAKHLLWKRVAYATRYGRVGLEETMQLGQDHLHAFLDALGEIVGEENKAGGSLSER